MFLIIVINLVFLIQLEYDTERAGNFEPLRFLPRGKKVVLGLISTKVAKVSIISNVQFSLVSRHFVNNDNLA